MKVWEGEEGIGSDRRKNQERWLEYGECEARGKVITVDWNY
jgi:hypothetical protein